MHLVRSTLSFFFVVAVLDRIEFPACSYYKLKLLANERLRSTFTVNVKGQYVLSDQVYLSLVIVRFVIISA